MRQYAESTNLKYCKWVLPHSGRIILYDNFKMAFCLQSKVGTTSILQMFLNLLPEEFKHLRNDVESLHREMGQKFSLKKSERYHA